MIKIMAGFTLAPSPFVDDHYLVDIYMNYNFSSNLKNVYKNVEDHEKSTRYKKQIGKLQIKMLAFCYNCSRYLFPKCM